MILTYTVYGNIIAPAYLWLEYRQWTNGTFDF